MGGPVSAAGVYHRRIVRLFHHALDGGDALSGTCYRLLCRVRPPVYESFFFGYLTAWSYWFMWMAVGISEITAIGVYVQFWFPEMAQWIPALIAVGLVALANLAAVRLYGEIEFWFAMIKVTTIIVMIIIGLGVIFFGFGNGGQAIGFGNLTEHGGFFCRRLERLSDRIMYRGGLLSRG